MPRLNRFDKPIRILSVLALVLFAPVHAANLKNVTEAINVTSSDGATVDLVQIAVAPKLFKGPKPDNISLQLTLEEHQVDGDVIPLGTWTELLANVTIITPDGGPDGRALVEFAVTTDIVEGPSFVRACVSVIWRKPNSDAVVSIECRDFIPL